MEEEKLLRSLNYLTNITVLLLISNSIAFSALKVSNFKKPSSNSFNERNNVRNNNVDNNGLPFNFQLNQDKEWLSNLSWQAKDITVQNILEKLKELSTAHLPLANKFTLEEIQSSKTILRIFVSSSMPVSLLKSYYRESQKFGGTLVFNGLPGGSFIKLTDLVKEIAEEAASASMQIDDEAFVKYNVSSVPTIVLSKEKDCWLGDCNEDSSYKNDQSNSSSSNYQISDQMSGNVSISYALSQFALSGELQRQAKELLK